MSEKTIMLDADMLSQLDTDLIKSVERVLGESPQGHYASNVESHLRALGAGKLAAQLMRGIRDVLVQDAQEREETRELLRGF